MKSLIFKNQKGVAAVELAIVLPFMALLIFGTIDMACLIYNKQVLSSAGRVAARRAIVRPDDQLGAEQAMKDYCDNKLIKLVGADYNIIVEVSQEQYKQVRRAKISIEYQHLLSGLFGINLDKTDLTEEFDMRIEKKSY